MLNTAMLLRVCHVVQGNSSGRRPICYEVSGRKLLIFCLQMYGNTPYEMRSFIKFNIFPKNRAYIRRQEQVKVQKE